jgi:hypothetical protein
MRRIQFIEIHDQSWFPSPLRDGVTDALQFGFNLWKVYAPVVPLLESALDATRSRTSSGGSLGGHNNSPSNETQSVIDLCSGGAGPWLDLSRELKSRRLKSQETGREATKVNLQISLTDKYPNLRAFQKVKEASEDRITFYPNSVDAMNVPTDLKGLRTMFTSFHHFPPEEARAILQNAVDAGEGIAIFEAPRRAPATIVIMFAWVLLLVLCTPWIRPFRWSRLLGTFVVPLIPAALWFDGVVSCLRAYSPQELREIVATLTKREVQYHYQWQIGEQAGAASGAPITYLIGYPSYPSDNTEPVSQECVTAGSQP